MATQTIYKYPLQVDDETTIKMPLGAKILTVQEQGGVPCIWALVNDSVPKKERTFLLLGTGQRCEDLRICESNYIGTFQLAGGRFVGHLFEAR